MQKNILTLVTLFSLMINFSGCCQMTRDEEKIIVTMVTDTSGLGDKGFNEIAWKGMLRARDELGVVIKKIESSDPANYVKNLSIGARYGDLTVANGFLILDAMKEVAELYPDKDFVFIDGIIEEENVASYTFRAQEVGFLVGIVASTMSEKHKVGILKGMNIPPVENFEYGFRYAAKCADLTWGTSTDVKSLTAGDFNDPQKGFAITSQFLNDDRDIVFQLAGATALGAINAIKNSKDKAYLIGVDLDQDDLIPGKVLTSAMKRIDTVVFNAIKAKLEGTFRGGHYSVGLKEAAMSITDLRHTRQLYDQYILQAISLAEEKIISREIKLPGNFDEVETFKPVLLEEQVENEN